MRYGLHTLIAGLLLFGLVACGGKNRKADPTPTEKKTEAAEDPVDLDEISPEELANSPCGNPDWSKLPPESPEDTRKSE